MGGLLSLREAVKSEGDAKSWLRNPSPKPAAYVVPWVGPLLYLFFPFWDDRVNYITPRLRVKVNILSLNLSHVFTSSL